MVPVKDGGKEWKGIWNALDFTHETSVLLIILVYYIMIPFHSFPFLASQKTTNLAFFPACLLTAACFMGRGGDDGDSGDGCMNQQELTEEEEDIFFLSSSYLIRILEQRLGRRQ